jgi:hypothetical protein
MLRRFGLSVFQIKVLAAVFMVIDHAGLFLFPQFLVLRIIGRGAFPLFAWCIANGAHYTKDMRAYLRRLFIFALISQVPFSLAYYMAGLPWWYTNVLFTLFLGLGAIYFINQTQRVSFKIGIISVCAITAEIIHSDYKIAGVLSIVVFYLCYKNMRYMALLQTFILGIIPFLLFHFEIRDTLPTTIPYLASPIEFFSIAALGIIAAYNHQSGRRAKYFFYWFYPLQFVFFAAAMALGL